MAIPGLAIAASMLGGLSAYHRERLKDIESPWKSLRDTERAGHKNEYLEKTVKGSLKLKLEQK